VGTPGSGSRSITRFIVGETNQDIKAAELIWKFFSEHPSLNPFSLLDLLELMYYY
jgi:poly(3-hydroxybutyrate) depolymerase